MRTPKGTNNFKFPNSNSHTNLAALNHANSGYGGYPANMREKIGTPKTPYNESS